MNIIITMAGAGTRFIRRGIYKNKHEIFARGKTLFEWSLLSLRDFFKDSFIFVVRKGCYDKQFIESKCKNMGILLFDFVILDEVSRGQAESAYFCDSIINNKEPVIIYNIDTYINDGNIKATDISENDYGYIPVFKAEGNRWSFLQLDQQGKVIGIKEKERISDYGTIGLYYFKKWELYKHAYRDTYTLDSKEEHYIAPIYNKLLEWDMKIGYKIINEENVHVLGTPEDISQFDPEYFLNNI